MKEKILSAFPYLLLALFFAIILGLNSRIYVKEPVFSTKLAENIPEISIHENLSNTEITKNEVQKSQSEDIFHENVQIIETVSDENNEEYTCFYTKSGTKYHLKEDCRYLKNSATIIKTTIEFAKDLGLEPCSGCGD